MHYVGWYVSFAGKRHLVFLERAKSGLEDAVLRILGKSCLMEFHFVLEIIFVVGYLRARSELCPLGHISMSVHGTCVSMCWLWLE